MSQVIGPKYGVLPKKVEMESKEIEIVPTFQETVKEERSSCRSCLSSGLVNEYHYAELLLSRTSQELQAPRTICFVISVKKPLKRSKASVLSVVRCSEQRDEKRGRGEGRYSGVFMHTRAGQLQQSPKRKSRWLPQPREGGAFET